MESGLCLTALLIAGADRLHADDADVDTRIKVLQQQNDALREQLRSQSEAIQSLKEEIQQVRSNGEKLERQFNDADKSRGMDEGRESGAGFGLGKVVISGEGAASYFKTGSDGAHPDGEFRIEEARLFVEAPVWGTAYAFAEVNLMTRESSSADVELGEFYLDVEDVSQIWGKDRQLNLRVGQFYTPYGEEYQNRYATLNPLISHSLPDFWGIDEGVEIYGALGNFSYAVAVQNGGVPITRDFTSDKSVAGRLSYDPARWLHLSVSGMRTGSLDVRNDRLSAMWFGDGWFRSLGSTNTTEFEANLVEGDIEFNLPRGHIKAFGGLVAYDDNDPSANNHRDVYYYSVEAAHDIIGGLYGAARFSQVIADGGFPVVGNGTRGEYLFGDLTENMWRLSLGLGYRWNRHLITKAEYSFERGKEVGGEKRESEDLFAVQAAFGF